MREGTGFALGGGRCGEGRMWARSDRATFEDGLLEKVVVWMARQLDGFKPSSSSAWSDQPKPWKTAGREWGWLTAGSVQRSRVATSAAPPPIGSAHIDRFKRSSSAPPDCMAAGAARS